MSWPVGAVGGATVAEGKGGREEGEGSGFGGTRGGCPPGFTAGGLIGAGSATTTGGGAGGGGVIGGASGDLAGAADTGRLVVAVSRVGVRSACAASFRRRVTTKKVPVTRTAAKRTSARRRF